MTVLYTADHEWLRIEGDVATVGITDYAQTQLGDVVFVDLPKVGRVVKKAEAAAVVESVKAASDVYAPISRRSDRGERGARRRSVAGQLRSGGRRAGSSRSASPTRANSTA